METELSPIPEMGVEFRSCTTGGKVLCHTAEKDTSAPEMKYGSNLWQVNFNNIYPM